MGIVYFHLLTEHFDLLPSGRELCGVVFLACQASSSPLRYEGGREGIVELSTQRAGGILAHGCFRRARCNVIFVERTCLYTLHACRFSVSLD